LSLSGFLKHWRWRLLGIPAPIASPDRAYLEGVIFAWAAQTPRTILFAGTRLYTAHYPQLLPGSDFHTIDIEPGNRVYGARGRHVTASVTALDQHYPPALFDMVILNGVIGWGLNERADVETALAQAAHVLKPGGILILGWNNVAPRNAVPPDSLAGLQAFAAFAPPFLSGHRHETATPMRHTFDFYARR
jgi:SAM-dependent methyltransferase